MQKQATACPAQAEPRVCDYRAPDFKMVGARELGSVPERSIGAVLKTVVSQGTVSSNPTTSATLNIQ